MTSRFLPCFAVLLALLSTLPSHAQTITGRVLDAVTLEGLPGANVAVLNADETLLTGTATDAEGRFSIDDLAPGAYTLRASSLGYAAQTKTDVVLQVSRATFVEFVLQLAAVETGELVVTSDFFEDATDSPVSVRSLGPEEIRRTPGGQNDISRSLLSLPGVKTGVDNRNDLLVRGGGPSENTYIVDGIEIPQINHFATQGATGGALGLLNVDFIREATFYTGGFPV
ncbi:MAG: carboxypeptidase regulatory-like domain-containing protein, partial [Bacteroidota bacterium]